MTEEEKAEIEAGKNKKPDAKGGKGAKKDEEPTPEELQKWDEEKKEREDINAKAKADWDSLDKNT